MKTKNKIYLGILAIAFVILFLNQTSAFAVSARYHEGNALYTLPGESKEVIFTLQNLGGAEDVDVKLEVTDDWGIIKIADSSDIYTIPAGGKTIVNLIVEIPINAKMKDVYHIDLRFTTVSKAGSGAFALGSSIVQRFDVIVGTGEIPESEINWNILLIISISLIIGIAVFFILRKKRKKH